MKMLKYYLLSFTIRKCCIIAFFVMTVLTGRAEAQTLLTESFNYTPGTLLTNANWVLQASGTPTISVSTGNLTYPNSILNNIGNKVSLSSSGQDIYHSFTAAAINAANPGVYSSIIVNVSAAQVAGDFFYGIGSSVPDAKVYIRSNGSGFSFGVGKTAAAAEYETVIRPFNTNIMLVLKYEFITGTLNDNIKLFINPASASEPAIADIVTAPAISDLGSLSNVFLNQGNVSNSPTMEVDGISVGRTWESVTDAVLDYGDVPAGYDFTKDGVYAPAAHTVISGLSLGSTLPDAEQTPASVVSGTDNNGTNGDGIDEDAINVSANQIRKGVTYTLSVPVTNPSAVTRYLYGWIDFNNDGRYQVEEFSTVAFSISGSSTQTLTWTSAQTATITAGTAKLYMRLRLSDRSLNDFTTAASGGAILDERSIGFGAVSTANQADYPFAPNGEVEDYQIAVNNSYEYGDVPVSFENDKDGNLLAATHAPLTGFSIGTLLDIESAPGSVAVGDDNNGSNGDGSDEDGISSLVSVSRGAAYSLNVPLSIPTSLGGYKYLYGWLDLNGDGRFQSGEIASTYTGATTGVSLLLTWTAAQTAQIALGKTKIYLRLRLSNLDLQDFTTVASGGALLDERSIGNGATSTANNINALTASFGEVEDYQLPVDLYDFGDAPVSYDNSKDNVLTPAAHMTSIALSLGSTLPDAEQAPASVVSGTDNNGTNGDGIDEDAINVSANQIRKGVAYTLSVPVTNPSAATRYLYGWIDFNNDGRYQVEEFSTVAFSISGSSTQTLTWTSVQAAAITTGTAKLYMRLRLSDRSLNDFTTAASGGATLDERSIGNGAVSTVDASNHVNPVNGEVEDYQIAVNNSYEYGDVPVSFENDKDGNLLAATHAPLTGFSIGTLIDIESAPGSVAVGDDNNGSNGDGSDEDGISSLVSVSRGAAYSLNVPLSIPTSLGGYKYLYGWLDLNGDGRFQSGEIASTYTGATTGVSLLLTWTAAQTAQITLGKTKIYLRLRLSNLDLQDFTTVASGGALLDERSIGNGATSTANNINALTASFGEVEDYQLPVDLYDFGDSPVSYDNSKDNAFTPAAHMTSIALSLGSTLPDAEQTPASVVSGTDNNGTNGDGIDEDAINVSANQIRKGVAYVLKVPVINPSAVTRYLYGWIDFNNDGRYQVEEFSTVAFSVSGSSTQTLTWTSAQTAAITAGTAKLYMRLRLSDRSLNDFTTAASGGATLDERSIGNGAVSTVDASNHVNPVNGEVEDYQIEVVNTYEYGDLPSSFENDKDNNPLSAMHAPLTGFTLGSLIDFETAPVSVTSPNQNNTTGDNAIGLVDEDALQPSFISINTGLAFSLTVPVSIPTSLTGTKYLYGWLDLNGDGRFQVGEVAVTTTTLSGGHYLLSLTWTAAQISQIASGASNIYLRLRLSDQNLQDFTTVATGGTTLDERSIGNGATSSANSTNASTTPFGEIEDYQLLVDIHNVGDIIDKEFLLTDDLVDKDNTTALVPIAYNTEYNSNAFISDNITLCNVNRNVYFVARNAGLRFNFGPGNLYDDYSVSIYFKFNPYEPIVRNYVRIIDVKDNILDAGIYRTGNNLNFYPNGNVGNNLLINSGTEYVLLTLTRNGATGLVKVYVNGLLASSYNDAAGTYQLTSSGNFIFIKDDIQAPLEQSPTNVAYIRVTNTLQSDQDILDMYNNICSSISPDSFCYKPAITSGVTLDTKLGITSLGRAGTDEDNWPMVRKGAWTAFESKTKGFVLNRLPFDLSGNPVGIPVSNFVEGMTVYDTTNHCLKIYTSTDGGTTFAWHCMGTQACPD